MLWMILGLLASSAVAAQPYQPYHWCVKSVGLKKPIRAEFIFPTDSEHFGSVIYQNGSGRVPVRIIEEKVLEERPEGPWLIQSRWEEVTLNGSGGNYVLAIQGAIMYELRYIRKKDDRLFKFEEDLDAYTDNGCEWNTAKQNR